MTFEFILFFVLALVAIISALGMVLSQNSVYSALFLILNLSTVAVFYLLLSAAFLAMVQVTVYAGAIMVLFLFVIMLLGAERLPGMTELLWQRPLAIALGLILFVEAAYIFFFRSGVLPAMEIAEENFGSPELIGEILFNQYLLPFEATSILLLVAMVGAVVLSRRTK